MITLTNIVRFYCRKIAFKEVYFAVRRKTKEKKEKKKRENEYWDSKSYLLRVMYQNILCDKALIHRTGYISILLRV